jgi:predicted CXXCH cytochrome family protein
MRRSWPTVALAFSLAACAGYVGFFGESRDQIKAPHDRHAKADVECTTCHETIFDSKDLSTVDLPKEKVCFGCHKEQKAKGDCGFCHTRPDKPMTFAARDRELKMNHSEHIERVKEDCKVCHSELPNPLWREGLAPKMSACLTCHEHQEQFDNGQCSVCHKDLSRYPLEPIAAFSHRGDFLHNHPKDARSGEAACGTCHEQTFCAECHAKTVGVKIETLQLERVDRSFIHRNDFMSRHSLEARANESECQRCHGTDFCQSCHKNVGLVPGVANGLNPHPPGFGQGSGHGAEARRDIVQCAACHDQGAASNCVTCHKVGGAGGNPHPPSFILRHPKEEISRNAMCTICHQ